MEKNHEPNAMLSISEVADLLGVHRSTISRFVKSGELRASRLGHRTVRIAKGDLLRFLQTREVPPPDHKEKDAL